METYRHLAATRFGEGIPSPKSPRRNHRLPYHEASLKSRPLDGLNDNSYRYTPPRGFHPHVRLPRTPATPRRKRLYVSVSGRGDRLLLIGPETNVPVCLRGKWGARIQGRIEQRDPCTLSNKGIRAKSGQIGIYGTTFSSLSPREIFRPTRRTSPRARNFNSS